MSDNERREIMLEMARLNLWRPDDPGDPITDKEAADIVFNRLEKMLTPTAKLVATGHPGGADSGYRDITVVCPSSFYHLASGATFQEATYRAALAIPAFLNKHPEYAVTPQ